MSFERALHAGPLEKQVRHLWKSYQEQPIRHWRHVWRLWKLKREFSFDHKEPSLWDWRVPADETPDCMHCPENCCKGPHSTVLLRLVDVALFVDRGWTDAMTLQKPVFSSEVLAQRPLLQEMVNSFHWRVFPVLKQREDGCCHWLTPDNLCGIHRDRPWVCRAFPYSLNILDEAVEWSSRCQWRRKVEDNDDSNATLRHAVFHSFYTEKVCDLVLLKMYREEIDAMGLSHWLRLEDGSAFG